MIRTRCEPTGKIIYRSAAKARQAALRIKARRRFLGFKVPTAVYGCRYGAHFHLTTSLQREEGA